MAGLAAGSQGFETRSEKTAAKGTAQSQGQAGVATCKRADYL